MRLDYESAQRFCTLLDGLTTFYMQSLAPFEFKELTEGYDQDAALANVRRAMWATDGIIDRFLAQDVFELSKEDKDVINGWKNVLPGTFFVVDHTPLHTLFMSDDMVFGVRGVTQEISDMLPNVPAIVQTTLMPFDGNIVYDLQLAEMPVALTGNLLSQVQEWKKEAMLKGAVCSGDTLAALAPSIKAKRANKLEEDRKREDRLEHLRQHPEERNTEGYHVGVLAGLNEAARKTKIQERIKQELSENDLFDKEEMNVTQALGDCQFEEPVDSFRAIVAEQSNGDAMGMMRSQFAAALGGDETKAKMVMADLGMVDEDTVLDQMASSMVGSVEEIEAELSRSFEEEYKTLRACMAQGGELHFTEAQVREGAMKEMAPLRPYTLFFVHNDEFTIVIPKEAREKLEQVNWVSVENRRQLVDRIVKVAVEMTQMCGIVSADELYAQFEEWFPADAMEFDAAGLFEEAVQIVLQRVEIDYAVWMDEAAETEYLVSYQLDIELSHYEREAEEGSEEAEAGLKATEDYLHFLLDRHQIAGVRRLPAKLREMESMDYKTTLPEMIALRNFLDAHVPDDKDDCFFADRVVEEIIDMVEGGVKPGEAIVLLQDSQGLVLDEIDLQEFLDLFNDALNALPRWENNGLAPKEMR